MNGKTIRISSNLKAYISSSFFKEDLIRTIAVFINFIIIFFYGINYFGHILLLNTIFFISLIINIIGLYPIYEKLLQCKDYVIIDYQNEKCFILTLYYHLPFRKQKKKIIATDSFRFTTYTRKDNKGSIVFAPAVSYENSIELRLEYCCMMKEIVLILEKQRINFNPNI